jgi:hypothetical protein
MSIWHSVISAFGIRVRYNPSTKVYQHRYAKPVRIRLSESSDFLTIMVRPLSHNQAYQPPLSPPEKERERLEPHQKPPSQNLTVPIMTPYVIDFFKWKKR